MNQARPLGVPIAVFIAFFAFADLLLAFPRIDLVVSGAFFTPELGFTFKGQIWEQILNGSVGVLMVVVNLSLIALWQFNRRRGRDLLGFRGRKLAFLFCLLILVPGLLVNQTLKEHWGRARPVTLVEFGGSKRFTPPFVYSDQSGGSFSSGHAAAAAYLVAVVAILAGRRSAWFIAALVYTLLVGFARIASGGHFLSDVVTSLFLVLIGYLALYRLFFRQRAC